MKRHRFSQKSLKIREGLHDDLQKVGDLALELSPYDFGYTRGLCTIEEQKALYAKGRTAPGPIVTWTLKSEHLTGHALDFVVYVNGKVTWEEKYYDRVADAFLEAAAKLDIPITWGGSWNKNPDRCHIELNKNFY